MIEYDICYKGEAFTKEKGYMCPASSKFREARSYYEDKLRELNAWEFMINRKTEQDQYEDCVRCIQDLRLRIWIDDVPFLERYDDVRAYYSPTSESSTLKKFLYTEGRNERLFASNIKSHKGDIRYFFLEISQEEGDAIHDTYREIDYDDFLQRLRR